MKRNEKGSLGWVSAFLILGFGAAAFAQARVHVIERDEIREMASRHGRGLSATNPNLPRGTIYDRDGSVIAQSDQLFEFSLHYDYLPKSPAFYMELAAATGIGEPELSQPGYDGATMREWRQKMTPGQAAQVQQVKKEWDANGVSLSNGSERDYPLAEAAAVVTGSMRDQEAITGLEKGMDALLVGRGAPESDIPGLDSLATSRIERSIAQEGMPGRSITLTIQSDLQVLASDAIRRAVETHKAERGSAVVYDHSTGDILAMAQWPTYNPARSPKDGADFAMPYMGGYAPGSTFKLLTLAKAMDMKVVEADEKFNSTSAIRVNGLPVRNHGGHAFGMITPEEAIMRSCNVTTSVWGRRIGRQEFNKMITDLRLDKAPRLGLPSQRKGSYIAKPQGAPDHLLATMSFGQSMGFTPVRLAAAYGALANDGVLMEPRLVSRVSGVELDVEPGKQIFSPETAREVVRMGESVIHEEGGTGRAAAVSGVRLSGKTGTAQKPGPSGTFADGTHLANFVGFIPAQSPQYTVLIMVDDPQGGSYYGGVVAAPAFRDIAKVLARRNAPAPAVSNEKP